MPDSSKPHVSPRRAFLRRAGTAAGVLVAAPLCTATAAPGVGRAVVQPAAAPASTRVAVLLPESHRYPGLGNQFLAGMQLALAEAQAAHIALLAETYGTSPARSLARARELITTGQADLIVTTASSGVSTGLHDLLQQHGTSVLVSSTGANVARDRRATPFIVRNSLNTWQASYALGDWAARSLGRRAVIVTSLYESGYDANYAFQRGFEQAGGAVVATHLTHTFQQPASDLPAVFAAIAGDHPEVVYAAYSGSEAVEVVQAYAASPLAGRVPLAGAGFLTDETLLPIQGPAAQGIYTVQTWALDLANEHNRAFTTAYHHATGYAPGLFAMLGYDTGRLVDQATRRAGHPRDPQALLAALRTGAIDGPRGHVTIDPRSHDAISPLYLRQVRSTPAGWRNLPIADLGALATSDPRFADLRASTLSGWLNAYLCV